MGALLDDPAAGFPLPRTLDVLCSLTSFVVGHAAAQAGNAGGADSMASLDPDTYPLLVGVARGLGEDAARARFDFALDARCCPDAKGNSPSPRPRSEGSRRPG
jgi:hypothetical protein